MLSRSLHLIFDLITCNYVLLRVIMRRREFRFLIYYDIFFIFFKNDFENTKLWPRVSPGPQNTTIFK